MRFLEIPDKRGYEYILIPMIIGFVVRIIYHLFDIPDFWGDSFHNIYISKSTIENHWIYSDYKGREVVWLPFYRYVIAFFMYLFGSDSMTVPHLINIIIGSISCGILARLTALETSKEFGALAGLILALLPWHIAYSHMNMPEMLGSTIILLIILMQRLGKWIWIIPLSFIGALTKNEVTLYCGVFGLYVIWNRDWRSAMALILGGGLALICWGFWNLQETGHFFWWITERSLGSSWDKVFYNKGGGSWIVPFLSIIQVFPLVLIFPILSRKLAKQSWGNRSAFLLALTFLVIFNWLFIIMMNFGYFPSPDARYFILTLPITCVVFVAWISKIENGKRLVMRSVVIISLVLLFQVPTFYVLHYILNPSIELGRFIQEKGLNKVNSWNDFPTSLYYGDIDIDRSFSSKMLAPKKIRESIDFNDQLLANLQSNSIQYVAYQNVPHSYVNAVWPQMKSDLPFEWKGLHFEPIFNYSYLKSNTILESLRSYVEKDRASSLWKVSHLNGEN